MSVAPIGIPAPAIAPAVSKGRPAVEFSDALDLESPESAIADSAEFERTRAQAPEAPRERDTNEDPETSLPAEAPDRGQAAAQSRALSEQAEEEQDVAAEDPALAVLAVLAQNAPNGQASEALTAALERVAAQSASQPPPQPVVEPLTPAMEAQLQPAQPTAPVVPTAAPTAPASQVTPSPQAAPVPVAQPVSTSAQPSGPGQSPADVDAVEVVEVVEARASTGAGGQSGATDGGTNEDAPQQDTRQSVAAVSVTPGAATARLLTGANGVAAPLPAREVPAMVSQMAIGGGGKVTLALAPEGLGTIVITVERTGDSVSVSVRGSAQAIAAIGHTSISDALTAKGIATATVDMQAVTATRSSSGSSGADQQSDSRPGDQRANANSDNGQSRGRQQREQTHDDIYHFWS